MMPLIDSQIEKIDKRHAELTSLNQQLNSALNLYHDLMRESLIIDQMARTTLQNQMMIATSSPYSPHQLYQQPPPPQQTYQPMGGPSDPGLYYQPQQYFVSQPQLSGYQPETPSLEQSQQQQPHLTNGVSPTTSIQVPIPSAGQSLAGFPYPMSNQQMMVPNVYARFVGMAVKFCFFNSSSIQSQPYSQQY